MRIDAALCHSLDTRATRGRVAGAHCHRRDSVGLNGRSSAPPDGASGTVVEERVKTLQFEVLGPRDDDGRVLFYEVYSDDAAFKVNWEGPFVARVRAETKDMIIKLSGTRCSLQE